MLLVELCWCDFGCLLGRVVCLESVLKRIFGKGSEC